MAKLTKKDLHSLASNPKAFFKVPANRAKALSIPETQLKSQIKVYVKEAGPEEFSVKQLITEVIKEV